MQFLFLDMESLVNKNPKLLSLLAFPDIELLFDSQKNTLINQITKKEEPDYLSLIGLINNSLANQKPFSQSSVSLQFNKYSLNLNVNYFETKMTITLNSLNYDPVVFQAQLEKGQFEQSIHEPIDRLSKGLKI